MPDSDGTTSQGTPKVWTVSELNRAIREFLEQSFYPFWLRGEISNLTIHRSGHVYLSLKDAHSQVSAVQFRGAAAARQLQLRDGLEVEAWGRLTVYEPRGAYQFLIERLRPCGEGALQQRFEELKRRLRAEGLFDDDRKRPIPALPRCVGVVTSPEGAAIRDFLQILGRRFANTHVRIVPAAVQGQTAAAEIAAGIRYLDQTRACDVIIVTRGGGSLEDLWPFNEEVVARAIAAAELPVISAVGHEVDFTIADFVADLRVPTPSAAAELVTAKKSELVERVENSRRRLRSALELRLGELRRRVERAARHPVFREPGHLVRVCQQRVDELAHRLGRAQSRLFERRQTQLERLRGRLQALDPKAVLRRGYAVLLNNAGQDPVPLTDAAAAPPGTSLRGILANGRLTLRVEASLPEAPSSNGAD